MKSIRHLPSVLACAIALALAGCGGIVPAGSSPDRSTKAGSPDQPVRTASAPRLPTIPRGISPRTEDRSCLVQLAAAGARFSPLPDSYAAPGCSTLGAVQLTALSGDKNRFGINNIGAVQCRTATTFNDWARFGVDRAARQILGSPLARIETMGSYACRNIAGSNRRSAHARAEAIDVSGFVLEDGRKITVRGDWSGGSADEREFLRTVHRSACKRFGTVLGPEYNVAHEDHFHLEGTGPQFCR